MNSQTTVQSRQDEAESASGSVVPRDANASALWHSLPVEKVLEQMHVTVEGLATEEAKQRLQQYGPNALRAAEPIHPLVILLGQFNSLVIWLLIGAGVVSGLLGEWIDSIAILTIVVLRNLIIFPTRNYSSVFPLSLFMPASARNTSCESCAPSRRRER